MILLKKLFLWFSNGFLFWGLTQLRGVISEWNWTWQFSHVENLKMYLSKLREVGWSGLLKDPLIKSALVIDGVTVLFLLGIGVYLSLKLKNVLFRDSQHRNAV